MIIKWCIFKNAGQSFQVTMLPFSLSLAMESKLSILVLSLVAHQSKYMKEISSNMLRTNVTDLS